MNNVDIRKDKHNDSQNEGKSHKEIVLKNLKELNIIEEHNLQSTPSIYQKSINLKANPCSSCCLM